MVSSVINTSCLSGTTLISSSISNTQLSFCGEKPWRCISTTSLSYISKPLITGRSPYQGGGVIPLHPPRHTRPARDGPQPPYGLLGRGVRGEARLPPRASSATTYCVFTANGSKTTGQ